MNYCGLMGVSFSFGSGIQDLKLGQPISRSWFASRLKWRRQSSLTGRISSKLIKSTWKRKNVVHFPIPFVRLTQLLLRPAVTNQQVIPPRSIMHRPITKVFLLLLLLRRVVVVDAEASRALNDQIRRVVIVCWSFIFAEKTFSRGFV